MYLPGWRHRTCVFRTSTLQFAMVTSSTMRTPRPHGSRAPHARQARCTPRRPSSAHMECGYGVRQARAPVCWGSRFVFRHPRWRSSGALHPTSMRGPRPWLPRNGQIVLQDRRRRPPRVAEEKRQQACRTPNRRRTPRLTKTPFLPFVFFVPLWFPLLRHPPENGRHPTARAPS